MRMAPVVVVKSRGHPPSRSRAAGGFGCVDDGVAAGFDCGDDDPACAPTNGTINCRSAPHTLRLASARPKGRRTFITAATITAPTLEPLQGSRGRAFRDRARTQFAEVGSRPRSA